MGFTNALPSVSRRGDWRRRVAFWDRQGSQFHDITGATLSLALFHVRPYRTVRHPCAPIFGVDPSTCDGLFWPERPILAFASDAQVPYLVPDGPNHGQIKAPRALIARIPEGIYRASIVAATPDGAFFEVLSELVRFVGPAFAPPLPYLTIDSTLTVDSTLPIDGLGALDTVVEPVPPTA